jgi:ferritin-like metal-binding protein YciE
MSKDKLREKLIDYIQDAHAMEQNVLKMLDSMIATSKDRETVARLQQHRQETERHEHLLQDRLTALGENRSWTADLTALAGAMVKSVGDKMRTDKPGQNARDGFITEHTEIAAYELLERLAQRAGDNETAFIARLIRQDEVAMAEWISDRWDKFIDLTLEEGNLQPLAGARTA